MKYRIKKVYRWKYCPGERFGVFHAFGWCLYVHHYRYFIDGKEVLPYNEIL